MERFKEALHIAISNLTTNAIRSILSVLGIVIGIAAVITILAIGAGAKQQIMQNISSMGVNVYYVNVSYEESTGRMGQLDLTDIELIEKLPFVETAFPELNTYQVLRARGGEGRGFVNGIRPSYMDSQKIEIQQGRNLSPVEFEMRTPVCLINETAARTLFPDGDAAGQNLFIAKSPWMVVGVYGNRERTKTRRGLNRMEVLAPLNILMRNTEMLTLQQIEVHVRPDANPNAETDLLQAIERDDPNRKGLYRVEDKKRFYAKTLEIQKIFALIGAIIAGISLIVGGIGMMNVMLTSVSERTREIGIRRAVGARKKDILFQFLVESCVLSGVGGFLGLILGAAIGRALPLVLKGSIQINPQLEPSFLFFSVAIGILLGVAFGFYPAVKASKLSPAEALRTE